MFNLGGGDRLARGEKSAQFASAGASISQFEDDFIFRPEIIREKYGVTDEQIAEFKEDREKGKHLPELPTVEELKELETASTKEGFGVGFSVTDKRRSYADVASSHPLGNESEPVKQSGRWPEHEYSPMKPLLDRILIKRVPDDPNLEVLQDGSVRDKRTGFIMPPAYRQHSNVGIVLAVGDFVVMGGVKTKLSEFVKPGDKVKFGDYNSEVYFLADDEVEKLCDAVQLNFQSDPEGLRVVRVQDIRTIQRRIEKVSLLKRLWRMIHG